MLQMYRVAGEVADAAVVNGRGILLGAAVVLIPIQLDTVNARAKSLTVQTHTADSTAECTGDVKQTVGIGGIQRKDRGAVGAERPCGMTFERHAFSHFQLAGHVVSGRYLNDTAAFCCSIKRGLDRRCIIGHAVTDCTECGDIKNISHEKNLL